MLFVLVFVCTLCVYGCFSSSLFLCTFLCFNSCVQIVSCFFRPSFLFSFQTLVTRCVCACESTRSGLVCIKWSFCFGLNLHVILILFSIHTQTRMHKFNSIHSKSVTFFCFLFLSFHNLVSHSCFSHKCALFCVSK